MPNTTHRSHSHYTGIYPGNLFMVVAPSGAGKSTLVNALLAEDKDILLSVSYTTREARSKETNGVQYHFVSVDEFMERRDKGEFLESAEVHGNYYATSKLWIAEQMKQGHDVLLEIDWQGARQVRQKVPDAVSVFILPPSRQALDDRMRKRGQDSEEVMAQRLAAAREEMLHYDEFDYVIVNEVFDTAVDEMCAIFTASRLRRAQQQIRHDGLIRSLLD